MSKKSSTFAADFKICYTMRRSIIFLIACLTFAATQAQTLDQPPLTFVLQTSSNGLGVAMNF